MKIFANKGNVDTAQSKAFRLNPVAAGCALLLTAMAANAYAADQEAPVAVDATTAEDKKKEAAAPIQTVVVSGIRRGIEAAISVKKNADSIVEAISAEDIGKLPDQSIAESISRLPGVSSQRVRGGGAQAVSIRGMSPDFSTALLNGREQVSTGDSRGVEFDQYPAELLGGVMIYKTPDGALVGQGLSGTIDLQTVRPLDFGKRAIAGNYRREKNGVGAGSGPDGEGSGDRFSISYIDQFADRKFGIALGFARLDGTSGSTSRFESWGSGETQYNGATVKVPYNGFNAWTDQSEGTRDGVMAVLQFRPSRDFNTTLDLFYSKYDRLSQSRGFQAPLNDSWNDPASTVDRPGQLINAVIANGSATSGTFNNVRPVLRNDAQKSVNETKSIGWATDFKINSDWRGRTDVSHNTASRDAIDTETYAGTTGAMGNIGFTAGSQVFTSSLNYADRAVTKLTDVQGWGGADVQAGYIKFPKVEDKISALRFSVKRDLPEGMFFSNVDLGLNISDRSKRREFTEALLSIKGGGRFASVAMPGSSTGGTAGTGLLIPTFDPTANLGLYDQKQKLHPDIYNKDWVVNEKVTTAFAKMNIDSTLLGKPLRGAVGLQLVNTEQDSTAYSVNSARPVATVNVGTSYTDVLPSANFILDVADQQSVRLSVSKIMARPTMNDMRASNSFGIDTTKNIYSGGGGNPKLDPFRAKGLDLSYERYWGIKAYASVAAFYKKIDTYIVTTSRAFDFTPYLTAGTPVLASKIGEFNAPINGKGGNMKGLEATVSLPLNVVTRYLDGFGVVVNAAVTSSDLNVPDTSDGGSGNMPLPGLSKQVGSLTMYYEKHGFSARVAQRYRSDFVGEITQFAGDRQATYIKAEKVMDLSLGYEFQNGPLKDLSFSLSVNNLRNAHFIRYRKTKDNVIQDDKYGKQILLGVNYKM
ncbi:TonB-dependent receptor [Massilia glaciei]|nr:TonB-dependent receptor [Massilia glaciei]